VASIKFVPRHCAKVFEQHFCTVTQKWSPASLYRDGARTQVGFVPGRQKLRHAFAHYGLGGLFFIAKFHSSAFNRSAPKTPFIAGPLYLSVSILDVTIPALTTNAYNDKENISDWLRQHSWFFLCHL
jgi:hypothetical protein